MQEMEAAPARFSEKWDGMKDSPARMSEKWDDMENPSNTMGGNEWDVMKQDKRIDPYSMAPETGNHTHKMKEMSKETPDNKVERKTQHNEFGSTREI